MCNESHKRGFGFGCRETPDLYNKFLERLGYYRKHVATDSSSLFRVVSELQYDIQLYHGKVRGECVKFIRSNRQLFHKDIKCGFESYLNNISRPRTYGGLLELKALALLYKANVFLFEPCTDGKWYLHNAKHTVTWRIFIGRDSHFDVVYPLDYMKSAAECQGIVYQLLYSRVLCLPDVEYAVERMLHDPDDRLMKYEKDATTGANTATTEDGIRYELCKPGTTDTSCVLRYSHLCHFHNHTNFPAIELFFIEHGAEAGCRVYIGDFFRYGYWKPNPLLREQNISCVRQLLAIGITPFPYKVAKSLDRHIYRNVEYDVWQEMRSEKLIEILQNEQRIYDARQAKRNKNMNALDVIKKVPQETYVPHEIEVTSMSEPNGTELVLSACLQTDSPPYAIAPYPLQGIYYPSPDQYGINTISIMPSAEAKNCPYAETGQHPIGAPGCLYNPYTPASPLHYHTQSPLKQLQPAVPPSPSPLQSNESLAVPDHITLVPHTLQHQPMPNEYMMMFDSMFQSPQPQPQQQQHHFPYLHQSPLQPQQQQHQQQQQQEQHHQLAPYQQQQHHQPPSPYVPRYLYHCVSNGTEANNNPYTAGNHSPVPGSAGFWRMQ